MKYRNRKSGWYRWTNHTFGVIIFWRVLGMVLFGAFLIAGFSIQQFPMLLIGLLSYLAALLLLVGLRYLIRSAIYWLDCRRSQKGDVTLVIFTQSHLR